MRVRPGRLEYNEGRIYAVIGARYGFGTKSSTGQRVEPTKYHHLLEFGTAPHIESWTDLAGKRKQYVHKGAAAYPTLRPAWDEKKGAAVEAIKQGLIDALHALPESEAAQEAFNSRYRTTYGGERAAGNAANRAERGKA